jgi:hypothetical protein
LAEGVRSITGDARPSPRLRGVADCRLLSASMPTTVPAFTDAAVVNQAIAVRQLA